MSGEVLSNDAVAALVEAARSGDLPEESAPKRASRQRRVRAVDFTRPTKFTTDQERKLRRSLEAFCRATSTRLSAEMRMPIELEVINSTQLLWSNAHAQLPGSAICGVVDAAPAGTQFLLAAELPLVLSSIDWLLGGTSSAPPRERKLTEIDWALAAHFFGTIIGQLSIVWSDIAGLELDLSRLDTQLETAQIAPVSEPTLILTMEARMSGSSATVVVLLPFTAIASVAEAFSADEFTAGVDHSRAGAVHAAISEVEVCLRAEVAAVELPVDEVLRLAPGDLLPLKAKIESGVTVFAESAPICKARPGRSGSRRGVQIDRELGGLR